MKNLLFIKNIPLLVFFMCCMAFGFDSFASAEDSVANLSNERIATVQVDKLTHELTLNKKQTKEVYKILEKRMVNMRKDHVKGQLSEGKIKKANENTMKQIESVLTAEQKTQFRKQAAELKKQKAAYYAGKKQGKKSLDDEMLNIE